MKPTIVALVIAVMLVGGAFALTLGKNGAEAPAPATNNVVVTDGVQIITISAKGGYSPRVTKAAAGLPTELHLETSSTYDCSAAVTIPSLNVREFLVPTGQKVVQVPPQKAGTTLRGLCAMGMYNFAVQFE